MRSIAVTFLLVTTPALARDPILSLPLDCVPGRDCYVQTYLDHDPGPGHADLTCGPATRDGHAGTDFALPSLAAMRHGVEVLAAAPGTVRAVRDGMPDIAVDAPDAPALNGLDCGNGVLIDHGGGWETQYCHLMSGSIAVTPGRRVGKGWVLGRVGLSGDTSFPHLHLSVRRDGRDIDPFLPSDIVQCGVAPPAANLWQDDMPYDAGGLVSVGVSGMQPVMDDVLDDPAALPPPRRDAPRLVAWALAYNLRAGDEIALGLDLPDGRRMEHVETLERTQPRIFRYLGRRAEGPWPAGDYSGEVTIRRDGQVIARRPLAARID